MFLLALVVHLLAGIIGGYNWWVFNNNTSSPAHSLSCTDQAGNLVTLFLGTNSNNISYWAVDQQDYVMTFGTSASLENSYQTLSYQYIS